MKKLFTYLLLFIAQVVLAQKDLITVNGRITDRDEPAKKMYGFRARLIFNDSLFVEVNSDSSGLFNFQISKALFRKYNPKIFVYQDLKLLEKLFPPPAECPSYWDRGGRYMGSRPVAIGFKENILSYLVKIELTPVVSCPRMPCIAFKKNSLELIKCEFDPAPDTVLFCLRNILVQNPGMVIELTARSWDEQDAGKLSLARGEIIRQKLLALGINAQCVVVKAAENLQPIWDKKQIKKAKTQTEKEALENTNRSLSIKVLAFDFEPDAGKNKKEANKQREDEE